MSDALLPGATLGVAGGGQLGRMFAVEARRMGYRVLVLTPEDDSPAGQVADGVVRGALDDAGAMAELADRVDALTFEFENVDAEALAAAEGKTLIRPGRKLLRVARDRRLEKTTFRDLGLPVPAFAIVEREEDLGRALESVGGDGVLKTALSGYDGKGQRRVRAAAELAPAWEELERRPCVFEGFVPFESEISVVAARGHDGDVALYEPVANAHANHILDVTVTPAPVSQATAAAAADIARALLEGLDVTGVLCTELFLMADGGLVVNEVAPRPHNSGHLTIEAHATSQFEQQVRAACGLPLGSTERVVGGAAMANLLGDVWQPGTPHWDEAQAVPGVRLHLYGKAEARPGRKMGHLTAVASSPAAAERAVRDARARLTVAEPAPS